MWSNISGAFSVIGLVNVGIVSSRFHERATPTLQALLTSPIVPWVCETMFALAYVAGPEPVHHVWRGDAPVPHAHRGIPGGGPQAHAELSHRPPHPRLWEHAAETQEIWRGLPSQVFPLARCEWLIIPTFSSMRQTSGDANKYISNTDYMPLPQLLAINQQHSAGFTHL